MVLVRIPATSANLGPGFDCLGIALDLYNYISISDADEPLQITLGGKYRDGIPQDETNLVYRAALQVWRKTGYKPKGISLHLVNDIPPARGLGSSSAAIVGGMYAANLQAGSPLTREEILALAAELEGHPDNVAPALYGGATLAIRQSDGQYLCRSLGNAADLKLVAAVPDMLLSTELSRGLLPSQVPLTDAVWNLSRTGLLVTSLLTKDYSLLKDAMEDRLHEPYRAKQIPGMQSALAAARGAGALGAVLSGAGPTLIAFTTGSASASQVGSAMQSVFLAHGTKAEIHYLNPDSQGAVEIGGNYGSIEAV